MKILTVTHFYESHGGGIEIVAGQLARQLAQHGHQCGWAASNADAAPEDPSIEPTPLNTFDPLEKLTGLPMPIPFPMSAVRLWRNIARTDGVIIHDAIYVTSLIAACSAWWNRKPYILIQHIGAIPFASAILRALMTTANRLVTRPMMQGASQTVFISHTVRAQFSSIRWHREPIVLFNGVDPARFHLGEGESTSDLKQAFGLHQTRPTILFVGRFVAKKGLNILREIAGALPEYDFALAGAGPINPTDWQMPNVRVLGAMPPARLAELYRAADALLLPSTGEGYPLVIQEALASGLPVFCGEDSAQADPGASRFLVGLPVDLAEPIQSAGPFITALRENRFERSRQAAAYAAQTYSWSNNAERLAELFNEFKAAAARRPGGGPRTARNDRKPHQA